MILGSVFEIVDGRSGFDIVMGFIVIILLIITLHGATAVVLFFTISVFRENGEPTEREISVVFLLITIGIVMSSILAVKWDPFYEPYIDEMELNVVALEEEYSEGGSKKVYNSSERYTELVLDEDLGYRFVISDDDEEMSEMLNDIKVALDDNKTVLITAPNQKISNQNSSYTIKLNKLENIGLEVINK